MKQFFLVLAVAALPSCATTPPPANLSAQAVEVLDTWSSYPANQCAAQLARFAPLTRTSEQAAIIYARNDGQRYTSVWCDNTGVYVYRWFAGGAE